MYILQTYLRIFLKASKGLWIIIWLSSCSTSISLDIDRDKWVADYEGCAGYRSDVYETIIREKENLLGLSTQKILDLLGNPNKNELYKRNQKFFVYRLSQGNSCGTQKSKEDLFLIFRFNAMGLANEIYLNDVASPTE
jgi:outer membrane protein assembly factor BamE (lipoprotein component of BamABCDE complex)